MFFCCWTQSVETLDFSGSDVSGSDVSGSLLEIRKPDLDVSVIQSGLPLCKSGLSGPLPSEILNTFEKLSRNILPPSPKEVGEIEVQASVETKDVDVQTVQTVQAVQKSVTFKNAISQTLVGENRLEVPRLH